MYKCEASNCKQNGGTPITSTREPCNKIIIEKRPKIYQRTIRKGKKRGVVEQIEGWEIAKEIKVCACCYEKITGLKAATPGSSLKALMQKKEKKPTFKKKKKFRKNKKPSNRPHQKRRPSNDRKLSN